MPNLYSYVLRFDSGFAPNPFGGVLTLATCKPQIRRNAQPGNWLLGTLSKTEGSPAQVVYAALVSEVVPLEEYGAAKRFEIKRPSSSGESWRQHGDNIYHLDTRGAWAQRETIYHGRAELEKDINGKHALICERFWYFGKDGPELPPALHELIKSGQGHKRTDDERVITALERWLTECFSEGLTSPNERPSSQLRNKGP